MLEKMYGDVSKKCVSQDLKNQSLVLLLLLMMRGWLRLLTLLVGGGN